MRSRFSGHDGRGHRSRSAAADTNAPLPEPVGGARSWSTARRTRSASCRSRRPRQVVSGAAGRHDAHAGRRLRARRRSPSSRSGSTTRWPWWIFARRTVIRTVPLPDNSGATGSTIVDDSIAYVGNPNLNTVSRVNYLTGATLRGAGRRLPAGTGLHPREGVRAQRESRRTSRPAGPSWLTVVDPATNDRASGGDSIPLTGAGNAGFADGRLRRAALRHEHRRLLLGRGASLGRGPAGSDRARELRRVRHRSGQRGVGRRLAPLHQLLLRGRDGVRPRQQQGRSRRRAWAPGPAATPPWPPTARAACTRIESGPVLGRRSRESRTCSTPRSTEIRTITLGECPSARPWCRSRPSERGGGRRTGGAIVRPPPAGRIFRHAPGHHAGDRPVRAPLQRNLEDRPARHAGARRAERDRQGRACGRRAGSAPRSSC